MKKINNNNRFRSNNGNSIYSLNYKFDSVSTAGKFTGTALDLIKRYNELAKEAQSRGDYVDMEVYRQYAEHYRKIVTEINARKIQNRENNSQVKEDQPTGQATDETTEAQTEVENVENDLVETEAAPREEISQPVKEEKTTKKRATKRSFTIVEVKNTEEKPAESANENVKPDDMEEKTKRRKKTVKKDAE